MTDLLEPPKTLVGAPATRRVGRATELVPPASRPAPLLGDLPAPLLGDLPAPLPSEPRNAAPTPTGSRRRGPRSGGRTLLLVELLAVAAVVAAAVFAMFWASALGERNDALATLDTVVAERDEAIRIGEQAIADRDAVADDLRTAVEEIERLQGEIDANIADLNTLNEQVGVLSTQVTDLTTANSELSAHVEELDALLAVPPAPEATFDPATEPDFSRYVGEVLSARTGASRLSLEQRECFGASVLSTVGLDGFGAGFQDGASTEANNALVGAMQFAADSCGIDQALIFS